MFSVAVLIPLAHQNRRAQNALTIWLALALTCIGEGFESLVMPVFFVFIWLGSVADSVRRVRGAA
jgi:hypothetical protein